MVRALPFDSTIETFLCSDMNVLHVWVPTNMTSCCRAPITGGVMQVSAIDNCIVMCYCQMVKVVLPVPPATKWSPTGLQEAAGSHQCHLQQEGVQLVFVRQLVLPVPLAAVSSAGVGEAADPTCATCSRRVFSWCWGGSWSYLCHLQQEGV